MPDLLMEAVCCSADDALKRKRRADRIELCGELVVGGLTPSLGTLIEARASTRLPIVQMIRPRAGGFCYSAREFATMRRDAELALAHGSRWHVFGVLRENGESTSSVAGSSRRSRGQPRQTGSIAPSTWCRPPLETLLGGVDRCASAELSGRSRPRSAGPRCFAACRVAGERCEDSAGRRHLGNRPSGSSGRPASPVQAAPFTPQPDTSGRASRRCVSGLQIPREAVSSWSDREGGACAGRAE